MDQGGVELLSSRKRVQKIGLMDQVIYREVSSRQKQGFSRRKNTRLPQYQKQQRICVLCVKLLQESISVSSYKDNDIRESNTSTHNHNCLMGTITFEVHFLTPTSPRNTLATIFKSILIIFSFVFLCIFFFLNISCMGI